MTAHALVPRLPRLSLADRMLRHNRYPTAGGDRGVFDVLKRRRETQDDPPDLERSFARVMKLRNTAELDELRDASIDLAAAAMAITVSLPARDRNPADK